MSLDRDGSDSDGGAPGELEGGAMNAHRSGLEDHRLQGWF